MDSTRRPMALLLCNLTLAAALAFAAPILAAPTQDVRIEHVTVISPEQPGPIKDADVLIHDGRIVALAAHGKSDAASNGAKTGHSPVLTINGRGLYLTPGLIDSHVHLGEIPGMTAAQEAKHPDIAKAARDQIPRSYLLYGFTTLIDLVDTPGGIKRWQAQPLKPDTYFCGPAPVVDGYPLVFMPKPQRYRLLPYMLVEPGTTAPAGIDASEHTPSAVVARMKADGAICVKTFFEHGFGDMHDLPVPKPETVRELVRAAHAAGLPVLLHANSSEAQEFGVETGVDIIAHGMWNWSESSRTTDITPTIQKTLDGILTANMGWQPTIQVLYGITDLFSTSWLANPRLQEVLPASLISWYGTPEGQWFHDVLAQSITAAQGKDPKAAEAAINAQLAVPIARVEHTTAALVARGGRLLFGTDTPSAPTYANPPGLNGWLEMHRLSDAGLTPAQIFQAATLTNAQSLKLDRDVGTVAVGKKANLLLLRADPTQSIDAYAGIVKVILGGTVLDPATLRASRIH